MNAIYRASSRSSLASALLCCLSIYPAMGSAQPPTYYFNLPQVPAALATTCGGGPTINDANEVAGAVVLMAGTKVPAFWSSPFAAGTAMTGAGGRFGAAVSINASGAMVGYGTVAGDATVHGLYWSGAGASPVLLTPSAGETSSVGLQINSSGTIAGSSVNTFSLSPPTTVDPTLTYNPLQATAWSTAGAPTTLPGGTGGFGINSSQQIAGVSGTAPVEWGPPLGGAATNLSCGTSTAVAPPLDINDSGAVTATLSSLGVGGVCQPGAASWTVLPGGAIAPVNTGYELGINSAGWITTGTSSGSLVLWIPTGSGAYTEYNLTSLLPASLAAQGWAFTPGTKAINNNNWISGNIVNAGSGLTQCFVLSTTPPPGPLGQSADIPLPIWALGLLGAAIVGGLARRTKP